LISGVLIVNDHTTSPQPCHLRAILVPLHPSPNHLLATGDELKRRTLTILKSELRPQVSPARDPRTKHEAYREEIALSALSPTATQNEQFSTVSPNYPPDATILTILWFESYEKLHFTGEMSYEYALNLSLIRLHCIVAKAVNLPKTFFARTPYCYATVSTSAGQTRHTKTIKHVDPIWNETFVL
jgi:hypothetical protein